MRRITVGILISVFGLAMTGCHKKLTVADFPLSATLTREQIEEKIGSPDRSGGHWIAYTLDNGSEIRLFFTGGERGGIRTLSQADVYGQGNILLRNLFTDSAKPKGASTAPSSKPTSAPTTAPAN